MLKDLVQLGASPYAKGSNNCTLVWQASYFGQAGFLPYLLDLGISLEHRAIFQDDESLSFTPLHAASQKGHSDVVRILLRARANVSVNSGGDDERHPLDDAVQAGHYAVVEYLVAAGADLFRRPGCTGWCPARPSQSSAPGSAVEILTPPRCIDRVFESRNSALVAAVAKGLKEAPALLDEVCARDLVQFLSCDGGAPLHILQAIFRPYELAYWNEQPRRRYRMMRRAGQIRAAEGMNVAEGPHFQQVVDKCYQLKQAPPPEFLTFVDQIAPQDHMKVACFYSPVTFFMCHIPLIHKNLNVLVALADCKRNDVFRDPGCQAIVHERWLATRWTTYSFIAIVFLQVGVLQHISLVVTRMEESHHKQFLQLSCWGSAALTAVLLFLELARLLGYVAYGLLRRYVSSVSRWYENITLLGMGAIVVLLLVKDGDRLRGKLQFKITLGAILAMTWMRLLSSLRVVEAVGRRIAPMSTTIAEAGPFMVVLLCFLAGSISWYHTLGISQLFESGVILYRLVMLGDIDPYEMENKWAPEMKLPGLGEMPTARRTSRSSSPKRASTTIPCAS
mmetsp:Transcript_27793/g.86505  ORF Transcript_27793/g.86505 Transcript_27793/m.86505 type:complete len:563 (+) Transcript_27793:2-1690(+)